MSVEPCPSAAPQATLEVRLTSAAISAAAFLASAKSIEVFSL